jgi:hypothetical protein
LALDACEQVYRNQVPTRKLLTSEQMMIVVVTGMVGVDKKSYLQNVCQLGAERGKDVLLCSVGDMMYAEAPDIPQDSRHIHEKAELASPERFQGYNRKKTKDFQPYRQYPRHVPLAARPVSRGGLRSNAPAQCRYVYLSD